jgi:hypothetical protein
MIALGHVARRIDIDKFWPVIGKLVPDSFDAADRFQQSGFWAIGIGPGQEFQG